jgi:hypothetical protein
MKYFILALLLAACATKTPPTVGEPPVVSPAPPPTVESSWWKPGPVKKFQITHFDSLSDLKKQFKKGTEVITLELDQIEDAGGMAVAEWVHSQGAKLIAYTSAGYEDWREDAKQFPADAKGGKICKNSSCTRWWEGEQWGKPTTDSYFNFQESRAIRAKTAGADGIEYDNHDWSRNKTGFTMSDSENLNAVLHLAQIAHSHGLAFFAKNTPYLASELAPHVEGVYIESCAKYEECDKFLPYKGKLVAMREYSSDCKPFEGAACYEGSGYFK